MQKIIIAIASLLILFTHTNAQSKKDELQKQRQQLRKEIEETERILNQTRKTTKENLGQLSLINKRLDLQGNVIQNIAGQLKFIENDIYKSQREVNKLARTLDTLKREYAVSMVYAYRNRNSYDFLNFIFSASSFNDAVKRITYLKSYRSYREQQGQNIVRTQEQLQQRINELSGNKKKKNVALQEKNKELTVLEKQQQEKERIVAKLKGRQKELTAQISNKRKQDTKLRGMINAMIKREIALANERARAERERLAKLNKANEKNDDVAVAKPRVTTPKRSASVLVSSEADRILDANFERNKGSLPWPADGFILSHFGRNVLTDRVEYNNPGVNIGTSVGAPVKAIFDGEVTLVNSMDDKQVVFIKHGKYFTVYSNLSSASVQRGQDVKTGQVIGRAGANDDGQGEVDLIIMKENNNVNPALYLRKK